MLVKVMSKGLADGMPETFTIVDMPALRTPLVLSSITPVPFGVTGAADQVSVPPPMFCTVRESLTAPPHVYPLPTAGVTRSEGTGVGVTGVGVGVGVGGMGVGVSVGG